MFFINKKLAEENQRLIKELEAFKTVQKELRAEMMFVEFDPQGRIRDVNELFTNATGYKANNVIGKSLSDLICDNKRTRNSAQNLQSALDANNHWHGTVSLLNASGETVISPTSKPDPNYLSC